VFIAVLIGSALEPLVGRLRGRLPIPRGAALLIVYVGFFALVALVALLVLPGSLAQAAALAAATPDMLERARAWADGVRPEALSTGLRVVIDALGGALRPGPPPSPGEIVAAGLSAAEAVVSVVTVLALVYFWMTERARLQRFTLSFLPPDRRAGWRDAWNDIELRLGGWVRGQLVLMTAVGLLTGTACWLVGLPSPLLLGLIAGLAEIIPMVGPAIGAIPAIVVAASVSPEALVLVILAYVVIHVVEGNILVPIVMRNAVGISPFLVVACLLVGGALDGLRGALVAVPVAAAIEVILERLQDREAPVAPTAEGLPLSPASADVTDPQASTTAV
jgi:predicted PurR-regulated permease PerM